MYLEELHQKFGTGTIDQSSNPFAFICWKYNISKLLAEDSPNENKNSTLIYSQTENYKEGVTSNTAKNIILK